MKVLILLLGVQVFAAESTDRIISLGPSLTEILYALDLESRIVGVSNFSDYPEAAKKLTRVGPYTRPSMEKIISLKPTLVVTHKEGPNFVTDVFKKSKIPVLAFDAKKLSDFPLIVKNLAAKFQRNPNKVLQKWETEWALVKKTDKECKVLIQIELRPLFVVGTKTFLTEVLGKCGCTNVVDLKGYPQFNSEALASLQPNIILSLKPESVSKKQIISYWKRFKFLKNSKLLVKPADAYSRLGPRLPGAVAKLCKDISSLLDTDK